MTSLQGDPSKWIPNLLNVSELMHETLIPEAWKVLSNNGIETSLHEDKVTNPFVKELRKAKRKIYPTLTFTIEGQHMVNPAEDDTGKVDIAVIHGGNEECYLAYECKWLERGKGKSLANAYVGENGLGRFISGKYAPEMPVGFMIGYVASGNHMKAITDICDIMIAKNIINKYHEIKIDPLVSFSTKHVRYNNMPITITHIMLACKSTQRVEQ